MPKTYISGSTTQAQDLAIRHNLAATTDPGVGDDILDGYAVGSRWINVTLDKEFVCVDATADNAVWGQTSGPDQILTGDTTTDRLRSTVTTVSSPGTTYALDLSAVKQEIAFVADQACTITISNIPALPITYILRASVASGGPFNLTFVGTNVSTYPSGDQPAAPASGEAVITIECNGTTAVVSQRIATSDVYDLDTQLDAKATTSALTTHTGNTSNPHSVTAAQVGAATTATKLDDFAAPDDNTDLNATASAHGLLPKLSGVSTEFLTGTGVFATPAGGSTVDRVRAPFVMTTGRRFLADNFDYAFGTTGAITQTNIKEIFLPLYFSRSDAISTMTVYIATGAGSAVGVLSVYERTGRLSVGSQIFRAGSLDFSSSGEKSATSLAWSPDPTKNYWACIACDTTGIEYSAYKLRGEGIEINAQGDMGGGWFRDVETNIANVFPSTWAAGDLSLSNVLVNNMNGVPRIYFIR